MRFNPDLRELIPMEQLDAAFGGEFEYEFEPISYWDQIVTCVAFVVHFSLTLLTRLTHIQRVRNCVRRDTN